MSKKEKSEWLGEDVIIKASRDAPTTKRFDSEVTLEHMLNVMKAAVEDKQLEDLPLFANGKEIKNFHISGSTNQATIDTDSKDPMAKPTALSLLNFLEKSRTYGRHRSILACSILYGEDSIIDVYVENGRVKLVTNKEIDDISEESDGRPSWDEYGLNMAREAASRADCTRRKVGAYLMAADNSGFISGYNGGRSKGPSCLKGECSRGRLTHDQLPADSAYDTGGGTCVALHAEWNILIRASWDQQVGATLYVTEEPCHICKIMIGGSQIARVVAPGYEWIRADEETLDRVQCNHSYQKCTKLKGHLDPHD